MTQTFVLYRILDAQGSLLYVGATVNPKLRFTAHRSKDWWGRAATITLEHLKSSDELIAAERHAIETEKPAYNHIYSKPLDWTRRPRGRHGDGTIFKRADGYWVAGLELPPGPNGKRRVKRFVCRDRDTALARREQFRASLELDANGQP